MRRDIQSHYLPFASGKGDSWKPATVRTAPSRPVDSRQRRGWGVLALLALLTVVVLLSAALLSACGGNSASSSPGASTSGSALLSVAGYNTVSTWDPREAGIDGETPYVANVYEPLLYASPPGSAEPFTACLATSWEVSKNGLTWTFHLRQGVKFHDGTPFTSAAVKYSIEAVLQRDVGYAYLWYPVKTITTPDDYTVKITTKYPVPIDRAASSMCGAWIFSPKTKGKSVAWWNVPHEDGTGPYELVSYKPNDQIVFKRNPEYWGGWKPGQFDQVVVKIVGESVTQRNMLEAGEVDFADNVGYDAVPSLGKNPNVTVVNKPSIQNVLIPINTQRKPLDNVKVRQALSYAIPYADIIVAGANGYAEQSAGPLPAGLYPHDPNLPKYTYDINKAKQLLAEAGYPNGGFKLLMTYASDDAYGAKLAPLVKEGLAKIGVQVDLQPMLFDAQWARAKGPASNRQDLMELLWWPGYPDGYDSLFSLFHSESTPYWNVSYWYDKTFDKLIDTAFSDEPVKPEQAQVLYNQAQQMLYEQAPAIYMFDVHGIYGMLPSLKLDNFALNTNYSVVLFWYHTSR